MTNPLLSFTELPRFDQIAPTHVAPAIDALEGYPHQVLDDDEVVKLVRGIDVEARVDGAFAALLDPRAATSAAQFVAFGERRPSERGDRFQPRVVMREPAPSPAPLPAPEQEPDA